MAISVFQNFGLLTTKISKNRFFWKMIPEIQNIQNFQKTITYVIHLLVVYQCTKFQVNSSIFDPQMECFCLRNNTYLWRHFSNAIFVTSGGRTQKQMTPLDSWAKTGHDRYLCFVHIYKFENLTFFDLTLTWPSLKTSKNGLRRPN